LPAIANVAIAAATSLILFIMFITAAATALIGTGGINTDTANCNAIGVPTNSISGYSSEQSTNAATIVAVGKQMHVPEHGLVTAIAAALQESGLRNLDHGDRDSLGLFQQRPSQGWGTQAQIMNPAYAATAFYRRLLETPDWQQLSVNDAAQAVQRSATPTAYDRHETAARVIAAAVGGATCNPLPATGPAAAQAITFARAQIGQPYLWGGDGDAEGGFDCSGLTRAAYQTAGVTIPRTAQTQHDAGPLLPPSAPLLPGDLVFFGNSPNTITHVGIAISSTQMINAPYTGAVIRIDPIGHYLAATRPSQGTAT
jgi:cell wall-associated NlpC family hydrolase